ncbi:hypothetical protein Tco_1331896, partial [Tanacetum coccineum]
MELIQNTMPVIVDEVTVCIRIFEIQGECNDLIPLNTTDKKVVAQNSDEDDDDSFGYDVFGDKQMDNFNGGGGWIKQKAENDGLSQHDIEERLSLKKVKDDLDHLMHLDLIQKAKVKWAIEGDENSKYFHGIVNNNFSRSRINGLFINDSWVSDPPLIIDHIFTFHKNKFKNKVHNRPRFSCNLFKTLTDHGTFILDAPFSNKEIKDAVWGCAGNKAPGPDGFTFKFIRDYWDTI